MAEMNDIVRLAVDTYHGTPTKYSVSESSETLRKAMVAANNGSTSLDYRAIRDGKCQGLFTLVEQVLSVTVFEGLTGTEFWNQFVDFRNIPLGDKNIFLTEDTNLFTVSRAAEGTQGIRRQRLSGVSETSIPTEYFAVRIYEEMNRVLAGRVDFNVFINKVSESFQKKLLEDIYTLWMGASANEFGATYFPAAGTYDEDTLLDLISHVEAAAGGKTATIVGTKKAVRNLRMSIESEASKTDLYNMGYYGNFFGTPVMVTPQRHKVGSTQFLLDDNTLTIIAGDDKPLKVVREGDPIMVQRDFAENRDFTTEFLYAERYGTAIFLAGGVNTGIGRYTMT